MGCQTQNTPADETSSASVHPWALSIDILSKTTEARIAAPQLRSKPRPASREGTLSEVTVYRLCTRHPEGHSMRSGVLSQAFQPFTLQLFAEAGFEKGMSVLE